MRLFRSKTKLVVNQIPSSLPSPQQTARHFHIVRSLLLLCLVFLLIACGKARSGPGYSMRIPEATITPAPVQTIAAWHELNVGDSPATQDADEVVAAIFDEGLPLFVALAQSGLWMGTLQEDGSYLWSRPPGLPEVLTTNEISSIDFAKFGDENGAELRVGTHNNGVFLFSLVENNSEWGNFTVENSELPSNKVNRIVGPWILTDKGAGFRWTEEEKWIIRTTEDGLNDNNALDINGLGGYGGGASLIATEKGVAIGGASSDEMIYSRISGGFRCHYEHVSRLYGVYGLAWLMVDQKDDTAPNGWRVAAICQGKSELFYVSWDPVVLDGVAPPDARIATHYQDQDERVWIAFSSQPDSSQGTLASYNPRKKEWTSYQLPAEMPAIADDVVMLMVGNDLWVENSGQAAFTVLEDVVAE